jgi:hypothetical protein
MASKKEKKRTSSSSPSSSHSSSFLTHILYFFLGIVMALACVWMLGAAKEGGGVFTVAEVVPNFELEVCRFQSYQTITVLEEVFRVLILFFKFFLNH